MDENMINEALGYDGGSDGGSSGGADTGADNGAPENTSTSESTVGTSAENAGSPGAETTPGDGNQGNAADTGDHTQSPEENSRYAAARRHAERERDRAIAEERERSAREADRMVESLGMVNPYTGQMIKTKAEYDAYVTAKAGEAKKNFLEQSGITEAQYQQMIQSLPEVQEALRAKAESERAAAEYRQAQAKSRLDEQMKEVTKLDPEIKSIDDLSKMENYDAFYALVKKGNSFADAYRLANFDKLVERSNAAEKQRVLNASAGKQHMTTVSSSQSSGLDAVPPETRDIYRTMFPDMNDEQIAKEFARFTKAK